MNDALYQQLIGVAEEYLGPAAPRFVKRQITAHLGKEPADVTVEDIPKLTEWSMLALSLLTEDRRVLDEYNDRMMELAQAKNLLTDGVAHNL